MTQDAKDTRQFRPATGEDGEFIRSDAPFRHWVTADGAPGPSGEGGFAAEPGRYHLYVSYACPWANRTLIFRALKGLQDMISVDVVHPLMGAKSWHFGEYPGATPDSQYGSALMAEIYQRARPGFDGVVTVPVLWDKQRETIVSNESSEIIRMFNSAFDGVGATPGDWYPAALRAEIDAVNERVYHSFNNGVYKCGFATSQAAYERALVPLFETMDWMEARLGESRYLAGDQLTEADWRAFVTAVRFDPVYVGHFKCNLRRLVDYPRLWAWTRELYQHPGIRETVNLDHIKYHYYASHTSINPTGVVPMGPAIDFEAPHGRNG